MEKIFSGKVVRSTGNSYLVRNIDGNYHDCVLKGKFRTKGIRATNPIAVGDEVEYKLDSTSGQGIIEEIKDRHNYLIRKATKLSKATHIIAANIDQLVVIASLKKPRTSSGFVDRLLTTSEAYHIPAIVVFNKLDLYNEENLEQLAHLQHVYENAGYKVLVTSVPKKINLDVFSNVLKNKVSLLAGHSGVGKTALVNAIDPTLTLKEGLISDFHEKGKHTTTFAEMHPLSIGGFIVDTPGIKEFGLVNFDRTELGQRFPEFRQRMANCRFNNCVHVNEPGCAVVEAVENGEIAWTRYQNYLKMLNDLND